MRRMSYSDIAARLAAGKVVVLDGATGTELERRGVPMDPQAWCGPATLGHRDVLEAVHRDYLAVGAEVITANTYASSRLMLQAAGIAERFEEINRAAIAAARRAREASGRAGVAIAGSLSHMLPMASRRAHTDPARAPGTPAMAAAFGELAALHAEEGCDLIALEMMYDPARMVPALRAAAATGLPVWAGLSARRAADGRVLSFAPDRDIPLAETVRLLADFDIAAAGVMHTPAELIGEAIDIVRAGFDGPLLAYPDSGYFTMPNWQFEDVIAPAELRRFAEDWLSRGVQVIGGCCGLTVEHIAALAPLRH